MVSIKVSRAFIERSKIKMEKEFVAYEYKDISIKKEKVSLYLECIANYGWEIVSKNDGLNNSKIKLKRNYKMANREKLSNLEKEFEEAFLQIETLEGSEKEAGISTSIIVGIIGSAFLAGSVFSYLASNIILMVILAIPGFIGWILPYFINKKLIEKKKIRISKVVENNYNKIYKVSEEAFYLNNKEKLIYNTKISIINNLLLTIIKVIFGLFYGIVFIIAGCFNAFMLLAKRECLLGIENNKISFKKRNNRIALFLLIASLVYIIYMSRLIFFDVKTYNYTALLGIAIATVSFIELGVSIYGLFKVKRLGRYCRNIKIINFCSALTAIVLTQIAILTFTKTENVNKYNGLSGIIVGIISLILAIYVYYAPRISIIDREHNEYKLVNIELNKEVKLIENSILLNHSKIYGDYLYKYNYQNEMVIGDINKTKRQLINLNIYLKIILIILSEILIFVYAIGFLIYFFKSIGIIDKLDKLMTSNGFVKMKNED
jgi:hypothetical protein